MQMAAPPDVGHNVWGGFPPQVALQCKLHFYVVCAEEHVVSPSEDLPVLMASKKKTLLCGSTMVQR